MPDMLEGYELCWDDKDFMKQRRQFSLKHIQSNKWKTEEIKLNLSIKFK